MTKQQQRAEAAEQLTRQKHVEQIVGGYILARLGRPPHYVGTQVKPLFDGPTGYRYRANVLVNALAAEQGDFDMRTSRIQHSFWLVLTDDQVTTILPAINKLY